MSILKSLTPVLQLLIVLYHTSKLTVVITHNSSRELAPLVLPPKPPFMYCGFLNSPMFRPRRELLIWADGRAGEDIFVHHPLVIIPSNHQYEGPYQDD